MAGRLQALGPPWLETVQHQRYTRVNGKRLYLIARATLNQDVFRTSVLNEKVEKYDTGNCEVV